MSLHHARLPHRLPASVLAKRQLRQRYAHARTPLSSGIGALGVATSSSSEALGGASRSFSTQPDDSRTTHFGFRQVEEDDKERLVAEVFTSVADQYDVMNDLMSGTLHRQWKDHFVDTLLPLSASNGNDRPRTIDLAGGTGDIAFRIVERSRQFYPQEQAPHVHVVDINQSMLDVGAKRAANRDLLDSLEFVQQNAEHLERFEDNTFDAFTIAFGIRNVTHIDKALEEAYRVLKPGGRFMCLEFSHLANPLLQDMYDKYSFNVIPAIGHVVANDRESYQYLVESIRKFPKQRKFERMIREAGFSHVTHENLTFGVVAVHSGFKL